MWDKAARGAKAGDRILGVIAGILCLLLLSYGAYSLWDNYRVMQGGFLDEGLLKYGPTESAGPNLEELMAINPDVVGWVTIDNTNINYPFVQGKDDQEYLNKDVYGNFALSGSVFLDVRNSRDMSDTYSLLYGHHMENGAMFGDIDKFLDRSFFDANTHGTLYTADQTFDIEIFAVVTTVATDSYVFNPGVLSADGKAALLQHIHNNATFERSADIAPDDRIIALSTCSNDTNGRHVLYGKLIPRS